MPLRVNLRHLEDDELRLEGELPTAELELGLKDEMCRTEKPLRYEIEVQEMEKDLLVQGKLILPIQCECVRCLKPFEFVLELPHWTRLLPMEGDEKTPVDNDCVDLTPLIREDILLAFPQHPLCENECSGLPKAPPKLAQHGSGAHQSGAGSSPWAELNKLKF